MKITIPLNYPVFFKEPRKPSWQEEFLVTDFEINIAEIPETQAELVMQVGELPLNEEHSEYMDGTKTFRVATKAADVRLHDGKFYVARFPAEEMEAIFSDEPTGEDYRASSNSPLEGRIDAPWVHEEHSRFGSQWRVGYHHPTTIRTEAQLSVAKGYEVKRFASYEADHRAVATALMENFVIIGDTVYEQVREPVLRVISTHNSVALVIDELRQDINRPKSAISRNNYGATYTFGIDEYDRAVEVGRQKAKRLAMPFKNLAIVDFVAPWAVSYRGESETLYRLAQMAYEAICVGSGAQHGFSRRSGSVMSLMGRQGVMAFYDLATAVEQHAEASPALIDAVRTLVNIADKTKFSQWFDPKSVSTSIGDGWNPEATESKESSDLSWVDRAVKERMDLIEYHLGNLRLALHCLDTKAACKLDWSEKLLDVKPSFFLETFRYYEASNLHAVNLVSEKLGIDLTGAATDAAQGRGNLFVVEDFVKNTPVAALYVSKTRDLAEKPVSFANSDNDLIHQAHIENILRMIDAAKPATNDLSDELEGLGL